MADELAPQAVPDGELESAVDGLSAAVRRQLDLAVRIAARVGLTLAWVGGGVRDLFLGRPHPDLDFVVEQDVAELAAALASELGGTPRTHPRFETATVDLPDGRIDLSRARSELYSEPGALPRVAPASLADDLARRDFTINAMALRLIPGSPWRPELLDPFGGRGDLRRARLTSLHPGSFRDDPTRILRGIGFELRLGFHLGAEEEERARRAIATGGFERLSGARLLGGLLRAAERLDTVAPAFRRLEALGASTHLGPIRLDLDRAARLAAELERGARSLSGLDVAAREALLLALAWALEPQERSALSARLALPARMSRIVELGPERVATARSGLATVSRPHRAADLLDGLSDAELAAVAAAEAVAARDWVALWWNDLRRRRPAITAGDLLEAGIPPGPLIGLALRAARAARLDGRLDRAGELAVALAVARGGEP